MTRTEMLALAEAEGAGDDGDPYRSVGQPFDSLSYALARAKATVDVTSRMVLPYQEPTCDGAREW
jgi:hypothetical protein